MAKMTSRFSEFSAAEQKLAVELTAALKQHEAVCQQAEELRRRARDQLQGLQGLKELIRGRNGLSAEFLRESDALVDRYQTASEGAAAAAAGLGEEVQRQWRELLPRLELHRDVIDALKQYRRKYGIEPTIYEAPDADPLRDRESFEKVVCVDLGMTRQYLQERQQVELLGSLTFLTAEELILENAVRPAGEVADNLRAGRDMLARLREQADEPCSGQGGLADLLSDPPVYQDPPVNQAAHAEGDAVADTRPRCKPNCIAGHW
jgi:hypothetical protein